MYSESSYTHTHMHTLTYTKIDSGDISGEMRVRKYYVCNPSILRVSNIQRWNHIKIYIHFCCNANVNCFWQKDEKDEHERRYESSDDASATTTMLHQSQTKLLLETGRTNVYSVLSLCSRWWSSVHILFVKQTTFYLSYSAHIRSAVAFALHPYTRLYVCGTSTTIKCRKSVISSSGNIQHKRTRKYTIRNMGNTLIRSKKKRKRKRVGRQSTVRYTHAFDDATQHSK